MNISNNQWQIWWETVWWTAWSLYCTRADRHILHTWHHALDWTQSVRVMFMDFAKAFDHVDHAIVLEKLAELGVSEFICRWFHSFLSDGQQRVKLGKTFSDWLRLNGGKHFCGEHFESSLAMKWIWRLLPSYMPFHCLQTNTTDKRDRCILPCMTHHTVYTDYY